MYLYVELCRCLSLGTVHNQWLMRLSSSHFKCTHCSRTWLLLECYDLLLECYDLLLVVYNHVCLVSQRQSLWRHPQPRRARVRASRGHARRAHTGGLRPRLVARLPLPGQRRQRQPAERVGYDSGSRRHAAAAYLQPTHGRCQGQSEATSLASFLFTCGWMH